MSSFGKMDFGALDYGSRYRMVSLLMEAAGELRVESRLLCDMGYKLVTRGVVTDEQFARMSLDEAVRLMLRVKKVQKWFMRGIAETAELRGIKGCEEGDFSAVQKRFLRRAVREGGLIHVGGRYYPRLKSVKQHLEEEGVAASELFSGRTSVEIMAAHPECRDVDWWALAKKITSIKHLEDIWAADFSTWEGDREKLVAKLREVNPELGEESFWYLRIRKFLAPWGGKDMGIPGWMTRQLDAFIRRERFTACNGRLFWRIVHEKVQNDASKVLTAESFPQLNAMMGTCIQALVKGFSGEDAVALVPEIDMGCGKGVSVLVRRKRDGATLLVVASSEKRVDLDQVVAEEKIAA